MYVSMASLELIEDQQKQRFMAARLGTKSTAKDDLKLMVNKFEHHKSPSPRLSVLLITTLESYNILMHLSMFSPLLPPRAYIGL